MTLKTFFPFVFFLLVSCATTTPEQNFKKEFKKGDISMETYLSLVKQAYIKGCIDGKNYIEPKKTKGKRFEICRDFSEKYIIKIEQYLKK